MPTKPFMTFNPRKLEPLYSQRSRTLAMACAGLLTVLQGQMMAQLTATSRSEVQTIAKSGTISGGTFLLSILGVDGVTYYTAALAYNISNADLDTAIEALLESAGFVDATVAIGGGPLWTSATVTFGGTLANADVPLLGIDGALLTGGGTVSVVETTKGRLQSVWVKYDSTLLTNPAAAPTVADTGTGSWKAGTYLVTYTLVTATGESLPSPSAVYANAGSKIIRVSAISTLDNEVTAVNLYINGTFAKQLAVTANATAQTDLDTTDVTVNGHAAPQVSTAYKYSDGRQVCKAIAVIPFSTDAYGKVIRGVATREEWLTSHDSVHAYVAGQFKTTELVGLDAKALADLGAHLEAGTLADGILSF